MIEEPALMTIKQNLRRASKAQIAAFQGVPTGFIADALGGNGSLDTGIRLVDGGAVLPRHAAGSALTCDNGPADILATLCALNFVVEGDFVVAAHCGYQGCAATGDRLCGMMKNGGAAGYVTDGPMRDIDGIVAAGMPAWCTGLNPASPFSKGPGRVGFPVMIGGRQVENGDIIVADQDGVVVVPHAQIDAIIAQLDKIKTLESELDAKVANGLRVPGTIAEFLASDKVAFED